MKMTAQGFSVLRENFSSLTQSQVDGINKIVYEIDQYGGFSYPQAAYILATIWHETDKTLHPIEEYGKGKGRPYGTWYKNSKGELYSFKNYKKNTVYLYKDFPFLYYGRGHSQNTWWDNYEKLSRVFGVDFLRNPQLLLQDGYSIKATLYALRVGLYTGAKLDTYINSSKKDYVNARRTVNGTDKAEKIAKEAEVFERALRKP